MKFGVVLQTTPPSARVVDLAKRAETYGFSTCGRSTATSCGRSRTSSTARSSPRPATSIVGPMVTNPATRDWTVTASLYATLNEMYGNRTVCGIGRGDSAVRVTNGKPTTIATLRDSVHVIRELANGRAVDYKGSTIALPVGRPQPRSRCGSPATAPRRWRSPARWATGSSSSSPTPRSRPGRSAPCATPPPRPGATPTRHDLRRRAGVRQRRPRPRPRPVPLVRRDGRQPRRRHRRALRRAATTDRRPCPRRSPTTSRAARATTTTSTARPATPTPTSCPTRSSTASACSARSTSRSAGSSELA